MSFSLASLILGMRALCVLLTKPSTTIFGTAQESSDARESSASNVLSQSPIAMKLSAACLFFTAAVRVSAAPVTIGNPGFEGNVLTNPSVGQNDNFIIAAGQGSTITTVPNWTFNASQLDSFTSYGGVSDLATGNHAPEGAIDNNIAWLFIAEGKRLGSISARQTLGATLQLNTRYTLSLRVAQSAHAEGDITLDNPVFPNLGNGVNTGEVFARLWVNSVSTPMPGFLAAASIVAVPADDQWVNWTLTWETGASEALAGGTLGIELYSQANTQSLSTPVEVFFDDVTLDATSVPEPSSALLVAISVLGRSLLRRRSSVAQ
jgi:hypothetical protein